jgi:TonB family protein
VKRTLPLVVLTSALLVTTAAPVQSQTSLAKARELYASARYDEALSMLNELGMRAGTDGTGSEDSASAALYRVLCLVAIGRSAEVDVAIERLVSQHPLYRPPSDELSPRIRTAVSSARLRLLPSMVQKRYEESKTEYDRGDFSAASAGFKWVLNALADPDIAYLAGQSPLSDIKTLAGGFAGLAEKALAPPPPAVVAAPPTPTPIPAPPPPAPVRDLTRVFTLEDTDVKPPVTVRQNMPRFPIALTTPVSGVLEVTIDAGGRVESVKLIDSVHAQYDSLLESAAKRWQYQPALLDGTAVRFTKRIQVSLAPSETSAPSGRR